MASNDSMFKKGIKMTTTDTVDTEPCEHDEMSEMLGLGIGFFRRCKACGYEDRRVNTGTGPEDWEYQPVTRL